MSSSERYDAVVLGAGHNGLVCAFYLAKAGKRVALLERRNVVGGAAVTEEFHPGFRNSAASYTVSLLQQRIIDDLELPRHGLKIVGRRMANFCPSLDGTSLSFFDDPKRDEQAIAEHSSRDAARYQDYLDRLEQVTVIVRDLLFETPPASGEGIAAILKSLRLGNRIHRLDSQRQRDLLALFAGSAGSFLDGWFESDLVKGLLGFDAIVGHYQSPYSPGSGYVLLHHVLGGQTMAPTNWAHAIGGMGSITQAMAAACAEMGVDIERDCTVREVCVDAGRAVGVIGADGRRWQAQAVVSCLHPKVLFQQLVDSTNLPQDFNDAIDGYRSGSGSLRINVALSELPDFRALPGKRVGDHHTAGIILGANLGEMEQAYFEARRDGWSSRPIIELMIPSTLDDTLAPPGQHVASLFCQHFAPELPNRESWDTHKDQVADLVIDRVNEFAPNFKNAVIARSVRSPTDLERDFGLVGGDIFHGELALDQLFSARPVLGYGNYTTPIAGLYQGGSGTHPGGGVTGIPGHNAARQVLRA